MQETLTFLIVTISFLQFYYFYNDAFFPLNCTSHLPTETKPAIDLIP